MSLFSLPSGFGLPARSSATSTSGAAGAGSAAPNIDSTIDKLIQTQESLEQFRQENPLQSLPQHRLPGEMIDRREPEDTYNQRDPRMEQLHRPGGPFPGASNR